MQRKSANHWNFFLNERKAVTRVLFHAGIFINKTVLPISLGPTIFLPDKVQIIH